MAMEAADGVAREPRRLLRPKATYEKFGCGKTKFDEDYRFHWTHGRRGCSTLPGRAGTSNAFSAACGSRTAPVDLDQRRHSGIGCFGRSVRLVSSPSQWNYF